MRQFCSILKATALEILSEPLSLLLLVSALTLATFAPAFHYHQFGEASRMARDAGFSSLFVFGSLVAVFGTVRAFRREIESGTLEMALSHPVSRTRFFLAKASGCLAAYLAFAVVIIGVQLVTVEGALVGGVIAEKSGDIARVWLPCLAYAIACIVLPLVAAAALNRFGRFRFCLSAFAISSALALLGLAAVAALNAPMVAAYLPVAGLIATYSVVLLAASAAAAVRWRANAAASAVGVLAALSLPAMGNYYLADALSGRGAVPLSYFAAAVAIALPALAAMLIVGCHLMNRR